jgi:AbrB family looped-hinge helix DNA binding protein
MQTAKSKLVEGGRIIVPAAFRRAMGLAKGDAVFLELHGDELRVRPARAALRRLQACLAPLAPGPGEPRVSDTLLEERRREAADA